MSKILQLSAATMMLMHGMANAGLIQAGGTATGSNGRMTSHEGACTVDFNAGSTANGCMATYSTDAAGLFALGANSVAFGSAPTHAAPVADTSGYLAVGTSDGTPVYVNLSMPANYFGFYAGSLDSYNLVEFFMDGVLVDSFDGAQINAVAFPGHPTTGNQAEAQYVDYFPGVFSEGHFAPALFNRIRISSAGNSFETDNHAFGLLAISVPEPGSLSLFGLGALCIFSLLRRRNLNRI